MRKLIGFVLISWLCLNGAFPGEGTGLTVRLSQVVLQRYPFFEVYVAVLDPSGQPLTTLQSAQFALLEDGSPVPIQAEPVSNQGNTLTSLLIIDRSGSMNAMGKLVAAKAAAKRFLDLLREQDRTGLLFFNHIVPPGEKIRFFHDKTTLQQMIDPVTADGNTALYDAIMVGLERLAREKGRRSLIVLTDGLNNHGTLRGAEGLARLTSRAKEVGIPLYTIGYGDDSADMRSKEGRLQGLEVSTLTALAEATGGLYRYAPGGEEIVAIYEGLTRVLQGEYVLRARSLAAPTDLRRHQLVVRVAAAGAQVNSNPKWYSWSTLTSTFRPADFQAFARMQVPRWQVFLGLLCLLGMLFLAPRFLFPAVPFLVRFFALTEPLLPPPAPSASGTRPPGEPEPPEQRADQRQRREAHVTVQRIRRATTAERPQRLGGRGG
jgi:VWFA-related protein